MAIFIGTCADLMSNIVHYKLIWIQSHTLTSFQWWTSFLECRDGMPSHMCIDNIQLTQTIITIIILIFALRATTHPLWVLRFVGLFCKYYTFIIGQHFRYECMQTCNAVRCPSRSPTVRLCTTNWVDLWPQRSVSRDQNMCLMWATNLSNEHISQTNVRLLWSHRGLSMSMRFSDSLIAQLRQL